MDLAFLKTLYQSPGPYASVYADLTRTTEDAVKAVELRWRALRADLEDQNTPEDTLRAVDRAVAEEIVQRRSEGIVIFAADGEVVHRERLPGPPRDPHAVLAPLPDVLPYLAARGERFPHLLAVVDRLGGAIDCVTAEGRRQRIDVRGDEDYPIRKVKAGDWNQARFQRSSEKVWKANAKKVAHEIDRTAERCGAEVVVISGDTHARTAVLEEVSTNVLEHTVEADKNTDIDDPDLHAEVRRLLRLKTAERVMTAAERFERELAIGERAVSGLPDTATALRHGQVETLLLSEDPDPDAELWIGPDPLQVAATPDELREEFGTTDLKRARADAALIRTAAATDSELVILPSDGVWKNPVGAVLRFTTTPDPDLLTGT